MAFGSGEAAVVGCENNDRSIGQPRLLDGRQDVADRAVHLFDHGRVDGVILDETNLALALLAPRIGRRGRFFPLVPGDEIGRSVKGRVDVQERNIREKRLVAMCVDKTRGLFGDAVGGMWVDRRVGAGLLVGG